MRLNVPLAQGLAVLALCTMPLLAQANCTSPNTDADYILGDLEGDGVAMHWESGLVWKRCLEGQSGSQCTGGSAQTKPWNDWIVDFVPQSFADLSNWWTNIWGYAPPAMPSNPPNRLLTGDWRMAYKNELVSITENCGNNPKLNRVVFPNDPSSYVWSGSPNANFRYHAWYVHFGNGYSNYDGNRGSGYHVRLVRAGQSFAPLASPLASPAAKTAAAGVPTDFAPITLASSTGSGQAWGGVRISGDGSPKFQINSAGEWVQEAIVKSSDQITVRLTAPAAGSHTATLTLRSGQTTGSADVATLGDEATTMQETSASFTVTASAAPVNGACGAANTWPSASAPSSQLCSSGTATTVTGSGGQWQWGCNGQYGGTNTAANACSAAYASQTLNIQANPSSILVNGNSTVTASSSSGLSVTLGISGPCTINGSTVTGTSAGFCTVTASQAGTGDAGTNRYLPVAGVATTINVTAIPTYFVTANASPVAGGTVTCTPNPVTHGDSASCNATPNTGYSFSSFSGDCSGNTCTLANATAAKSVRASFTLNSYAITATADPAEGGSVSCTPNPVPHGNDASCSATPNTGYSFSSFGGDCSGSSCDLSNVTSAKSVTASFTLNSYAITATASPTAGGSVTCSPASVEHGGSSTCTAMANAGYTFGSFSGDCSGNTCELNNVTEAKSVTALFTQNVVDITLPEGPQAGQPLGLRLEPGQGWQLDSASTQTLASLGATLPPGWQAPHGVVRLQLSLGAAGSSATVVLSYPQNLPPGTRYYKYGPTTDDATPHWYAFDAAVISGNTITLTLTDGADGDDDLAANSTITDPGGPAVLMGTPVAVPTLSEWAMLLMAGLLGVLGAGVLRRRAVA